VQEKYFDMTKQQLSCQHFPFSQYTTSTSVGHTSDTFIDLSTSYSSDNNGDMDENHINLAVGVHNVLGETFSCMTSITS